MKKLFAIVAVMGVLTFGSTQLAQAQDAPAAEQTEQAAVAPAADAAAPLLWKLPRVVSTKSLRLSLLKVLHLS